MPQNQAFGLLLVAVGVFAFFLIVQLWSRTRTDPFWILRGEFREMVGPAVIQVINAFLLAFGAMLGTGAVCWGLMFLHTF